MQLSPFGAVPVTSMVDDFLHQGAVALMMVHVLEFAKKIPVIGPKLATQTTTMRIFAGLLVFIGALGVKFQMTGSIIDGGTIMIAWPMWSVILDTAEHLVFQWFIQETYYQKRVKTPEDPAPVSVVEVLPNPPHKEVG